MPTFSERPFGDPRMRSVPFQRRARVAGSGCPPKYFLSASRNSSLSEVTFENNVIQDRNLRLSGTRILSYCSTLNGIYQFGAFSQTRAEDRWRRDSELPSLSGNPIKQRLTAIPIPLICGKTNHIQWPCFCPCFNSARRSCTRELDVHEALPIVAVMLFLPMVSIKRPPVPRRRRPRKGPGLAVDPTKACPRRITTSPAVLSRHLYLFYTTMIVTFRSRCRPWPRRAASAMAIKRPDGKGELVDQHRHGLNPAVA